MATKDPKSGYIQGPKSEYDPMTANVICPSCGWEGPIWNKKTGRIHMYCPKCDFGNLKPTETDRQLDEPLKKESKLKSFGFLIQEQGKMINYKCPKCGAAAVGEEGKPLENGGKCKCGGSYQKSLTEGEYEDDENDDENVEEDAVGVVNDLSDTIDDVKYSAGRLAEIIQKLNIKFVTEFNDRVGKLLEKAKAPGGPAIVSGEIVDTIADSYDQLDSAIGAAMDAIDNIIQATQNAKEPGEVE